MLLRYLPGGPIAHVAVKVTFTPPDCGCGEPKQRLTGVITFSVFTFTLEHSWIELNNVLYLERLLCTMYKLCVFCTGRHMALYAKQAV